MPVVGTAKRWQRSLDRGAWQLDRGLISHSVLQFSFGALITGRLMEDGCLIGGHLMEVQLYTEWDDNHVCIINQ